MERHGVFICEGCGLKDALDLEALYGSVPDSILIAVGGYGSADGGALTDQAPVGNGNGNIERAEYYVLRLTDTGVVLDRLFLDLSILDNPDHVDIPYQTKLALYLVDAVLLRKPVAFPSPSFRDAESPLARMMA